jgi:transcriptional regulator with XRE-family HTH domain
LHKQETTERALQLWGEAIRKKRLEMKLSQEELAEMAHVHHTYVSRVEAGKKNISYENIHKIAYALRMKPSWLLDRAGL